MIARARFPAATGERAYTHFPDLLGVNERQEGQQGSSKQVRALMSGDRGHMRTMRLLPLAAAADEVRMTGLSRRSSAPET